MTKACSPSVDENLSGGFTNLGSLPEDDRGEEVLSQSCTTTISRHCAEQNQPPLKYFAALRQTKNAHTSLFSGIATNKISCHLKNFAPLRQTKMTNTSQFSSILPSQKLPPLNNFAALVYSIISQHCAKQNAKPKQKSPITEQFCGIVPNKIGRHLQVLAFTHAHCTTMLEKNV